MIEPFEKILGKIEKQKKDQSYPCFSPQCTKAAIMSHSQQKEGQLRSISDDGIVYSFDTNVYSLIKRGDDKPAFNFKRVGIKEASTFQGFCSKHDQSIFAEIEKNRIQKDNKKQAFLFHCRAATYEFVRKRSASNFNQQLIEELKKQPNLYSTDFLSECNCGIELFLERDGKYLVDKVFEIWEANTFDEIQTIRKVIPKNLLISCCCCINPLRDSYGSNGYELSTDYVQPVISFTIIPEANSTHVIFSWLKEFTKDAEWLNEKTKVQESLESLINLFAFCESEDTCISPKLWDNIPQCTKNTCVNAMRHHYFRGELEEMPKIIVL